MQYLGGKSRISKDISSIINKYSEGKTFVSLFCGTCSVESKVISNEKICNDLQEYLIEMFKACQNGHQFPEIVTKADYEYCKSHKDLDKALTGFIGFGCSFGGKWFGGYAQNARNDNYAIRAKNSLMKTMRGLTNTVFLNLDYRLVAIPDGSIVYCDPPYNGTTAYSNSNNFSHDDFWNYMRFISKRNKVFISELDAPDDFEIVWQRDFKRVLDVNKNNIFVSTEKLFSLKT